MLAEKSEGKGDVKVCLECNRQFTGIVCACPNDGSTLVPVMQDPLIGTTLMGKYEIQSVVGHGGMGVVYKAKDTLDRLVAIKMLKAQLISDTSSVKRFHHEGKAAGRINHPHVVTVHEFGISPSGQPFIVMDFLEGTSLAQVIKDDGHVGVERSVKILMQACDALSHAHRHGVVHRDLKPSNIVLIDYDGQKDFVKVVDFGVAKLITGAGQDLQRLTQQGEVCGSPVYMSPEQCQGEELDARSDIYSMGVVMYETLTGNLPFFGQTMVETMSKHITEKAAPFIETRPDLYIPERLEEVVFRALSKDKRQRQESMAQLKQDLELSIPRPGRSQVLRSGEASARTSGSFEAQGRKGKFPVVFRLDPAISLLVGFGILVLSVCSAVLPGVSPVKRQIEKLPPPGQTQGTTPGTVPAVQGSTTPVQAPMSGSSAPVQGSLTPNNQTPTSAAILSAPELAVPKSERGTSEPKGLSTKATTPGELPQRSKVSVVPPVRRKAYSTVAEESALRQRIPHRPNNNQAENEVYSHNGRRIAHRKNKPGPEAPPSKTKTNFDPFADLDRSHSYEQDWKHSK